MAIDKDTNTTNSDTLNCLDVCRELSADPNTSNTSIKNHIADCETCAAYAKQQNSLTNSIEQAINITAPDGLTSRILLQQSINEKKQIAAHRNRVYAVAASVLIGISLVSGLLFFNSPTSLEQVALNHVKNELHHLDDKNNVQLVKLNNLLHDFHMKFDSSLGQINYAGSCTIRKSKGVHIIVQTKTGPVTILFMPGEFIKNQKSVDDAQFSGFVTPIKNGSFAIIGGKKESLRDLEQTVKDGISFI